MWSQSLSAGGECPPPCLQLLFHDPLKYFIWASHPPMPPRRTHKSTDNYLYEEVTQRVTGTTNKTSSDLTN